MSTFLWTMEKISKRSRKRRRTEHLPELDLANQRMAAALKARGYHYHYDHALGAGHVDGRVVGAISGRVRLREEAAPGQRRSSRAARLADTTYHWHDDAVHLTKERDIRANPGAFLQTDGGGIATSFVSDSAARPTPADLLEDYRLSAAGSRFEEQANYVRAYANDLPRLKELLPNIQTPVLILAGRSDPIVPTTNGQFLKDRLPRSRFTLLEGGHLVWEDAAKEYADHLASWLGGAYRSLLMQQ